MLSNLLLKYKLILCYGSKKVFYIIFKTLCLLIFFIPYAAYSLYNFICDLLLFIPSFLPIVGLVARLLSDILRAINALLIMLLLIPDAIFKTENIKLLDELSSSSNF